MNTHKLIVVIPLGPNCKEEFVRDTIDSIIYYCSKDTKIIIVDDSNSDLGSYSGKFFKDISVIKNSKTLGKGAGLYLTLCKGFKYAIKNYSFDVLLRMDTDALITGEKPENIAIDYFKKNPKVGVIGSYNLGYNGDKRFFSWPEKQLSIETSWRNLLEGLNRYKGIIKLRNLINSAKKYNYVSGEHCMGGAVFYSYKCINALNKNGFLPLKEISWSKLPEDSIFGLLVKSLGIKMGEFNGKSFPLGVAWKGLPDSPENLFKRGKKVIHSTKNYKDLSEADIREYFKQKRT